MDDFYIGHQMSNQINFIGHVYGLTRAYKCCGLTGILIIPALAGQYDAYYQIPAGHINALYEKLNALMETEGQRIFSVGKSHESLQYLTRIAEQMINIIEEYASN